LRIGAWGQDAREDRDRDGCIGGVKRGWQRLRRLRCGRLLLQFKQKGLLFRRQLLLWLGLSRGS